MDHKFIISLGVGLFIQAAAAVWWLATLSATVQHNDFQIQMIAKDVEKNSEFHQELKVSGELYADNALPIVVSRTGLTTFRHSEEAQSCVSIRASADGAGTLTFSEEAGTILSDGGALTIGWTGILYLEDDNTQAATLQDLGGSAVFQLNNNSANAGNFNITVNANGGTDITTLDSDGALGHLSFAPNGDLKLNPSSAKTIITATDGLYFDGGTHTYIDE